MTEPTVDTRESRAAIRRERFAYPYQEAAEPDSIRSDAIHFLPRALDLLDARDETLAAAEARVRELERALDACMAGGRSARTRIAALEARLAEREGR